MNRSLLPLAIVSVLLLAGCQKSSSEVAENVADARTDAAKTNQAARDEASEDAAKSNTSMAAAEKTYAEGEAAANKKLTAAEAEAMTQAAESRFDVLAAEAQGRYDIAKEACGALTGVDKTACVSKADETHQMDRAAAIAERDAALVAAEHHD